MRIAAHSRRAEIDFFRVLLGVLDSDGTRRSRQNDPDFGEFTRLCIDLDRTAMLLDDDVVTNRKGRGQYLLRQPPVLQE